jgi:pyrimidine operon attenuation protein / uracil phosphoribosyltransferase
MTQPHSPTSHLFSPVTPTGQSTTVILDAPDMERTLKRLTLELLESNHGIDNLVLVGLVTRGKYLAQRIAQMVQDIEGKSIPVGWLDVTLFRDDTGHSFKPTTQSHLPVDMIGKRVVLVDDVIFKGRTIRAALDALTSYGRPESVRLMVLLDRGHRDLPIHPDFVGKQLATRLTERVNVQLTEVDGRDEATLS